MTSGIERPKKVEKRPLVEAPTVVLMSLPRRKSSVKVVTTRRRNWLLVVEFPRRSSRVFLMMGRICWAMFCMVMKGVLGRTPDYLLCKLFFVNFVGKVDHIYVEYKAGTCWDARELSVAVA